jgi:hypothetical protein
MVLATVIRLEFAYPGVGIFAGDSIQYLSIATAHAVVMVFFMIMPLIFGAFANFLLPTQLGVHDVAFPRLNSAAFWFLPGGLLMLAQLVCVDRRYQRMNCFNIREIQSILKKRFFVDLMNEHNHRKSLHKTMVGVKFKINTEAATSANLNAFYNYGTEFTPKKREFAALGSTTAGLSLKKTKPFFFFLKKFENNVFFITINLIFVNVLLFFSNFTLIGSLFKNILDLVLIVMSVA